jgi:hypothetical protein
MIRQKKGGTPIMSQRGLILALQRFHDDPGFRDLVAQDPQSTLGIYDLDDNERQQLMSMDEAAMHRFAIGLGLNWGSGPVSGVGALDDSEVSVESSGKPGVSIPHDNLPGNGQGVVHP